MPPCWQQGWPWRRPRKSWAQNPHGDAASFMEPAPEPEPHTEAEKELKPPSSPELLPSRRAHGEAPPTACALLEPTVVSIPHDLILLTPCNSFPVALLRRAKRREASRRSNDLEGRHPPSLRMPARASARLPPHSRHNLDHTITAGSRPVAARPSGRCTTLETNRDSDVFAVWLSSSLGERGG